MGSGKRDHFYLQPIHNTILIFKRVISSKTLYYTFNPYFFKVKPLNPHSVRKSIVHIDSLRYVSQPSYGSISNRVQLITFFKKEVVRSKSSNLITLLQIGSSESRNSAMDSLLSLLHEDDKNVMIVVAQGVVPVLVWLMDSSSVEMKEKTVAAISRVSMVDSCKHVLLAEGLNHLLRVLDSGSGFAKEKACVDLHQSLSFSKQNAEAIGCRGGISSPLEICQGRTSGSEASTAGVLRNLASFPEIKENFVEENGVVVLLGIASSGTVLAQENAIGCLCNLVT
ncbi:uncharacterized protein LOC133799659 [Humulus lupulus]|uniref:uncharacterized protein LOC133799659 n=1 Tax=Humulus lupulus TaxID=3486 RepID=UPI002B40F475|nr:uncharacterized protein LOC133799659 [Humulus lupulus]